MRTRLSETLLTLCHHFVPSTVHTHTYTVIYAHTYYYIHIHTLVHTHTFTHIHILTYWDGDGDAGFLEGDEAICLFVTGSRSGEGAQTFGGDGDSG